MVLIIREYLSFGEPDDVVLYHCQDEAAVEHLAKFLEVDGQTNRVVGLNIENPADNLKVRGCACRIRAAG